MIWETKLVLYILGILGSTCRSFQYICSYSPVFEPSPGSPNIKSGHTRNGVRWLGAKDEGAGDQTPSEKETKFQN